MTIHQIPSFAAGEWVAPGEGARDIASAITGEVIASAGNDALDVQRMLDFARDVGGPALRKLTFHDRARMLKALSAHLSQHKQALYDLSFNTGATQADHLIDIDGGIGTMFVYASKGRREM
ncbi:MAG: aldehyde dehydrogenase family protein, partial [Ruegeria sp.]